jgi:hypothetical protein
MVILLESGLRLHLHNSAGFFDCSFTCDLPNCLTFINTGVQSLFRVLGLELSCCVITLSSTLFYSTVSIGINLVKEFVWWKLVFSAFFLRRSEHNA